MTFRRKKQRGHPVALLLGLKEDRAMLWKVFSNVIKPEKAVQLVGSRTDQKAMYNFHEAIVTTFRPSLREGVKSIVLASPPKTDFAEEFLNHVKDHDAWLTQGETRASFAKIRGAATELHEISLIARSSDFRQIIQQTTNEETENLLTILEKQLNSASIEPLVLYSFDEIETKILGSWIPGKPRPEYLIVTETFASHRNLKNRLQRIQQIAINKGMKTRIISSKSAAGKRISQLGGIVCVLKAQ